MAPENMKSYNIRVRPSTWEQARAIADARGDRISDVIRQLLAGYIRRHRHLLDNHNDNE